MEFDPVDVVLYWTTPPVVTKKVTPVVAFSTKLSTKSIALAVVKSGKKLKGKKLIVPMENKNINVTITDTVFYDKENKRLNA